MHRILIINISRVGNNKIMSQGSKVSYAYFTMFASYIQLKYTREESC